MAIQDTGSLISAIDALSGTGRSLLPYAIPALSGFEEWLAENQILGPNSPDEMFESTTRRGIFEGWERLKSRFRHRRAPQR